MAGGTALGYEEALKDWLRMQGDVGDRLGMKGGVGMYGHECWGWPGCVSTRWVTAWKYEWVFGVGAGWLGEQPLGTRKHERTGRETWLGDRLGM